jgi:hypothetical protein
VKNPEFSTVAKFYNLTGIKVSQQLLRGKVSIKLLGDR